MLLGDFFAALPLLVSMLQTQLLVEYYSLCHVLRVQQRPWDTDTVELCCEQGFASELLGEVFTKGKGPFGQLGIPLGQPLNSEYAGVALAVWVSTCSYTLVYYMLLVLQL